MLANKPSAVCDSDEVDIYKRGDALSLELLQPDEVRLIRWMCDIKNRDIFTIP